MALSAHAVPYFEDVAQEAGIEFRYGAWVPGEHNEWFPEITGSGVCWFDYDRDGWLDLYFTNAPYVNETLQAERDPGAALYRNLGDGSFADVTLESGLVRKGFWDMGCSSADYDADGWPDLFVAGYDRDVLYHNEADGTFAEVTESAGVVDDDKCGDNPCWGHTSSWVDYDLDGDLDLYLVNYVSWNQSIHTGNGPRQYEGQRNLLWENQGDGTFLDRTDETNLTDSPAIDHGKGLGQVWFDHDLDGCPDVYIASDQTNASLMHNDCNGHFTDIAAEWHVNDDYSGMGTIAGDVSGDGRYDLYKTHYEGEPNTFYVYEDDGTYRPIHGEGELLDDLPFVGWGTGFFDFDHDGDMDVYVANGHTEHFDDWMGLTIMPWQTNLMFFNDGDDQFRNVTGQLGPGWEIEAVSRGSAVADYDWDGDLDMAVANNGDRDSNLLRASNVTGAGANWLIVEPRGSGANWQGVGAGVVATLPDGSMSYRHVMSGSGYLSQDMRAVHFGLGDHTVVDLEVIWPDGTRDLYDDVAANRLVRAVHGGGLVTDTLGPVTTLDVVGALGAEGWFTSTPDLRFTATDHGLLDPVGVARTEYRLDGGWREVTGPVALHDGVHEVAYRSEDAAGNPEVVRRETVHVDTEPPTVTAVTDGVVQQGWLVEDPAIVLSAEDATSGVDRIEYRLNDRPVTPYADPVALTDGVHDVWAQAVDVAGLVSEAATLTQVRVDTTPASIGASADHEAAASGWYLAPIVVQVHAEDQTSGVAEVTVDRNGAGAEADPGPWTWTDGRHTLTYAAENGAGLVAEGHATFDVDTEAPTSALAINGTLGDNDWYVTIPEVTITASDATSGVARIEHKQDQGTWAHHTGPVEITDGTHSLSYRAADVAGHMEAARSVTIGVDTVPPEADAVLTGTAGTGPWYRSAVEVRLSGTDGTSGLARVEYRLDDDPWQTYAGPFVLADGVHRLHYRAIDLAGHVGETETRTVRVDTVAPELAVSYDGTAGLGGWFVSPVAVDLVGTDDTSGVAVREVRVDAGPWQDVMTMDPIGEGVFAVQARVVDAAGHETYGDRFDVSVDLTPPVVSVELDGMHLWRGDLVDVVSETGVRVVASDATSGVAASAVRVDAGPWTVPETFRFEGPDGLHDVAYRAVDIAGNHAAIETIDVRVRNDAAPPLTLVSPSPDTVYANGPGAVAGSPGTTILIGCTPVVVQTGDHVSGTRTIEVEVRSALESHDWSIGADTWDPLGVHLVRTLVPGPDPTLRELTVTATDWRGNTNVTSITFHAVGAGAPETCVPALPTPQPFVDIPAVTTVARVGG